MFIGIGRLYCVHGCGNTQWCDGTQHPWEFKPAWHLEPSLTDPDTVYAGVEDAALFKSTDGGKSWKELSALRGHPTGSQVLAVWRYTPLSLTR